VWSRAIAGTVLALTGAVWILQGTNVLRGSGMSGRGEWTAAGVAALALGLALLGWARRMRSRHPG
jgi:hypothetical protein